MSTTETTTPVLGRFGSAAARDAILDRPRTVPTKTQRRCLLPSWDEVARRPLRRDVPAVKRVRIGGAS